MRSRGSCLLVVLGFMTSWVDLDLCPGLRCRCLDAGSIMACQRSRLTKVPAVLQQTLIIDLDQNRISVLANSSFRPGFRLEMVSLQDNGLVRLDPDCFRGLPELRILRLGRNRLSGIPENLFRNNGQLLVLDLHENRLTSLPEAAMHHVHSLQLVNVSYNRLTTVAMGTGFRYTTQLSNVDLSGNHIVSIDSGSFLVASSWDRRIERHFNLSNCHLRYIHPAALKSIPLLRTVSLDRNHFRSQPDLSEAVRSVSASVRILVLSRLNITDISDMFGRCRFASLLDLDLAHNRIGAIPPGAFSAMEKLRRLDLSHNEIAELDAALGVSPLEKLDLSSNRIARIDEDAFKGLEFLKELDLSRNFLSELDERTFSSQSGVLRFLDLSENRLVGLPSVGALDALETLRASRNRIAGALFVRHLTELRHLDLSHNAIWRIDEELFALANRREISVNLSHNALRTLSKTAFRFVRCEFIDITGNRLRDLDYHGWESVQTIHAAENQIRYVGAGFFNKTTLVRNLYLQGNLISHFPSGAFEALPHLRNLDLSRNPVGLFIQHKDTNAGFSRDLQVLRLRKIGLESLPVNLIRNLTSLELLDLSENQIESIDASVFAPLSRLRELNLAGNRLRDLARSLAETRFPPVSVDLSDNRLDCSCRLVVVLRRLLLYADAPPVVVANLHNRSAYRCHSPKQWHGTAVEDFLAGSSWCLTERSDQLRVISRPAVAIPAVTVAIVIVVVVVVIIIVVVLILILSSRRRRFRRLLHRKYEYVAADCRGNKIAVEEPVGSSGKGRGGGGGEREEMDDRLDAAGSRGKRGRGRGRGKVAKLTDEIRVPIILSMSASID